MSHLTRPALDLGLAEGELQLAAHGLADRHPRRAVHRFAGWGPRGRPARRSPANAAKNSTFFVASARASTSSRGLAGFGQVAGAAPRARRPATVDHFAGRLLRPGSSVWNAFWKTAWVNMLPRST